MYELWKADQSGNPWLTTFWRMWHSGKVRYHRVEAVEVVRIEAGQRREA